MDNDARSLSDADLHRLLAELEDEEREISARRRRLHRLIEYRRTMGSADGSPATEQELSELDAEEREVSRARSELHTRLDQLRAERDSRRRR